MSITALSPEAVSKKAADLVAKLKELAIKKISWTIYDDSDENNLVDVVCAYDADRVDGDIEDEGILWDISGLFLCETGMFEVNVDAGLIKRLGDAFIPTDLEYAYYEIPETLQAQFLNQTEKAEAQDSNASSNTAL